MKGRPAMCPASPSTLTLRHVRVLLVEDDADSREIFTIALQSRGACVTTAISAREALDALHLRPHIVVTDIKLGGEDGYWLLEQIRARAESATLPVIAVTGRVLGANGRLAPLGDFDAAAVKPVDPFALCDLVAQILGKGQRAGVTTGCRED